MKHLIRPALTLFVALSLVTGLAYPLLVTGIARAVFPRQAAGSLLSRDGKPVGSSLIGQAFSDPGHFWSRPSAAGPRPYDGLASGSANQGPLDPALADAVRRRIDALRAADPGNAAAVPADLVTTSASGLDPHISLAAARFQAARIAQVRKLPQARVDELIAEHAEGPWLGLLGEPRVNVLALNLALDALR